MTPAAVYAALLSHGRSLGRYAAVLDYEPKSRPAARGDTLALWAGPVEPVTSGLSATSARLEFTARLYRLMKDGVSDQGLLESVSDFVLSLSQDFDLGGQLRCIDLLGAYGAPLAYDTGYVVLDSTLFRIADIRVPLIANDVWMQAQ